MSDRSLAHLDPLGGARMTDVTPREPTHRRALARCRVSMAPETTTLVANNAITKGDVLAAARIAGIQAAKRTAEMIPMCHPVLVGSIAINFSIGDDYVEVEAQVETVDRTGVEMEAMMACTTAALTVYDMCKSSDRTMTIDGVALWEKSGGRSGRGGDPRVVLKEILDGRVAPVSLNSSTVTPRVADRIGIGKGITGTVISGIGQMGGRDVVIARSFSSERRGALTHADGVRLAESADLARRLRIPFIFIVASSGADVLDGVAALHGWGNAAAAIAACSGVVPVLMAATGPVVSGPALLLGLADLVVMNAEAVAFVSGPQMVAEFTGVEVGLRELGGVATHARSSGLCAVESDDVEGTLAGLLEYLPSHADEMPSTLATFDPVGQEIPELRDLIPERKSATYDVRDIIRLVVDDGEFRELWPRWAGQIVTGFCRIGGFSVGIVANQPRILAGTLDIAASQKAARFVRLCDSFNLPLVTMVDTPGFLPGKDLEWRGMIRHGAELAFAYAQATVPRICLILRKAFGGAYIVMDSRGIGNDVCLAWPAAEIAVMGASGAVQILHRGIDPPERAAREVEYDEAFLNPWPASERGLVDQVIDPADTRTVLALVLHQLATKRELVVGRKHDAGPQ